MSNLSPNPQTSLPILLTPPPPEPPAEVAESEGSRWGKAHHVLLLFTAAVIVIWLLSGFYRVNASELAIVERLGEYVKDASGKTMIVEPGIRYAIPWPVDKVFKLPVQQTRTLEVRTFNAAMDSYDEYKRDFLRAGARPELLSAIFDPYLITGDKNVVHIELAVKYRIRDPHAWLTTISHQSNGKDADLRDDFFQQIAAHVLIQTISRLPADRVLFEGSDRLPAILNQALSEAMKIPDWSDPAREKTIDMGVLIQQVEVVNKRPPTLVKGAFERVLQSRAEKENLKTRAETDADRMKSQAGARRDALLLEAESYAKQTIEAARGDASRFSQIYAEYEKAPDVTKYRLYSETLRAVTGNAERIFWVQPKQSVIITIDPPKFDASRAQPK